MLFTMLVMVAAGLLAGEMAVRQAGLTQFPLFVGDPQAGYRARPAQAGRFLNRFYWSFDANGMRALSETAGPVGATLLVGDSVVEGGNRIDQRDTLAARLERAHGEPVYPLACRGWALANELAALEGLPHWREAKRLVLVLNTGDFETVGSMQDRFAFPTRRPSFALAWLVRKRLRWPRPDPRMPECRERNLETFARLAKEFSGEVAILRYPLRNETTGPDPYFVELGDTVPSARLLDLARASDWGPDCYADHIHPNARGIEVLARFVAQELR